MKLKFVDIGETRVYENTLEASADGFKVIGHTKSWAEERAKGYTVPRAELDNRPMFEGYLGPMYDADALRYESHAMYDRLSR